MSIAKRSDIRPWAKLKLSRKSYEARRPWKAAGMPRAQFEALIEAMPVEVLDGLKLEAQAQMLLESVFGKDVDSMG